jgi:hypothetical protein
MSKIHLGNGGKGGLECGATAYSGPPDQGRNWTWKPERVTCKRCKVAYRKRV